MWVIKIGGSLQHADDLPLFLAELVEHAAGMAVIVPGGGNFADYVRQEQAQKNLDEITAHRMALRAMEDYGDLLVSLEPRLQPARSAGDVFQASAARKVPVWYPYAMVADNPAIPACWDVTSDSLALWFADQLQCRHLFILKATVPGTDNYSVQYLSHHGYLDKAYHEMSGKTAVLSWWLVYQQAASFFQMLDRREYPASVMKQITMMHP